MSRNPRVPTLPLLNNEYVSRVIKFGNNNSSYSNKTPGNNSSNVHSNRSRNPSNIIYSKRGKVNIAKALTDTDNHPSNNCPSNMNASSTTPKTSKTRSGGLFLRSGSVRSVPA